MTVTASSLTSQITQLITNNDDTIVNIKNILMPITQCITTPGIAQNLDSIVTIIMTDRDGNKTFDVNDLKLLSTDPIVIMELVTSFVVILSELPNLQITISIPDTEVIIFKLLMYILLVIVPSKTGANWSTADKTAILLLATDIFQLIQTLGIVQIAISKLIAWTKSSKYCTCLTVTNTPSAQDKLPETKINLAKSVGNARDKATLHDRIEKLEKKIV